MSPRHGQQQFDPRTTDEGPFPESSRRGEARTRSSDEPPLDDDRGGVEVRNDTSDEAPHHDNRRRSARSSSSDEAFHNGRGPRGGGETRRSAIPSRLSDEALRNRDRHEPRRDSRSPRSIRRVRHSPQYYRDRAATFVDSLPIVTRADLPEDRRECGICLQPYLSCRNWEVPVRLPCNPKHIFGKECLTTWLASTLSDNRRNACPLCRKALFQQDVTSYEDEIADMLERLDRETHLPFAERREIRAETAPHEMENPQWRSPGPPFPESNVRSTSPHGTFAGMYPAEREEFENARRRRADDVADGSREATPRPSLPRDRDAPSLLGAHEREANGMPYPQYPRGTQDDTAEFNLRFETILALLAGVGMRDDSGLSESQASSETTGVSAATNRYPPSHSIDLPPSQQPDLQPGVREVRARENWHAGATHAQDPLPDMTQRPDTHLAHHPHLTRENAIPQHRGMRSRLAEAIRDRFSTGRTTTFDGPSDQHVEQNSSRSSREVLREHLHSQGARGDLSTLGGLPAPAAVAEPAQRTDQIPYSSSSSPSSRHLTIREQNDALFLQDQHPHHQRNNALLSAAAARVTQNRAVGVSLHEQRQRARELAGLGPGTIPRNTHGSQTGGTESAAQRPVGENVVRPANWRGNGMVSRENIERDMGLRGRGRGRGRSE